MKVNPVQNSQSRAYFLGFLAIAGVYGGIYLFGNKKPHRNLFETKQPETLIKIVDKTEEAKEKIEQKAKAAIEEAIDEPPAKSVGKLAEKAEETKEKVEQKAKTA